MAISKDLIEKQMRLLGISWDEAVQLIAEDARIDKMTSTKDIESDLTEEQKKSSKTARQTEHKPPVYKFDVSKRAKKENSDKREIIAGLQSALAGMGASCVEATNIEREIVFYIKDVKYKLTLSQPRS